MTSSLVPVTLAQILTHSPSIHSERILVNAARADEFAKDCRHPARAMESFAKPFAGGHHINQERHIVADLLPVKECRVPRRNAARWRSSEAGSSCCHQSRSSNHDGVLKRQRGSLLCPA